MKEFEFYEKKDDIESALRDLGMNLQLDHLELEDKKIPYVEICCSGKKIINEKKITLEEGEDNFKIKIYTDNFLSEHPLDVEMMKEECDVEKFLDFAKKEQEISIKPEKGVSLKNKALKLIGINFQEHTTEDILIDGEDTKYKNHNRYSAIVYGEDKEGNIYRIETMTCFGVDMDLNPVHWGEIVVEELKDIDKDDLVKNSLITNKDLSIHFYESENKADIDIFDNYENIFSITSEFDDFSASVWLFSKDRIYLDLKDKFNMEELCQNLPKAFNINEEIFEKIVNPEQFSIKNEKEIESEDFGIYTYE